MLISCSLSMLLYLVTVVRILPVTYTVVVQLFP